MNANQINHIINVYKQTYELRPHIVTGQAAWLMRPATFEFDNLQP